VGFSLTVVFALLVSERARPRSSDSFRFALGQLLRRFRYLVGVGIFGADDLAHAMLILADAGSWRRLGVRRRQRERGLALCPAQRGLRAHPSSCGQVEPCGPTGEWVAAGQLLRRCRRMFTSEARSAFSSKGECEVNLGFGDALVQGDADTIGVSGHGPSGTAIG
jgi:hypothetical protein